MDIKKKHVTETCKDFASYRPTNDTGKQFTKEKLEMAIKKTAADVAKDWEKRNKGSYRAESNEEMENILEIRRNNLEDSNLNFVSSLIKKINKSNLPKKDKKQLVKFIQNQHFDYETLYELCYLHLNPYAQPYVDYLKLQLKEGTKFNVKLIDYIIEKLKYTFIWSDKIKNYLGELQDELNQITEISLNYYALEKCPVCGSVGNIYANVRNYGAYIGVAYICNCHEGDE